MKIMHVATIVVALVLHQGPARAQTSTNFQINAAHTGSLVTQDRFAPPLKLLWAVDLGAPISYPIVAQDMVFVTTEGGGAAESRLYALSAKTGKIRWSKFIEGGLPYAYAAFDKGVVYALASNGVLEASAAVDGTLLWTEIIQAPNNNDFAIPPVAAFGSLYVAGEGNGGELLRLDETTGAPVWALQGGDPFGVPAIDQGTLTGGVGCEAFAVSTASGVITWQTTIGCGFGEFGAAAAFGGNAFVSSPGSPGALLDLATGVLRSSLGNAVPAFFRSLIVQTQGSLTAAHYATGAVAWTLNSTDSFAVPPIIVNGIVYALSSSGNLYAVSAVQGKLLQKMTPGVGKHSVSGFQFFTGLGAGAGVLIVPSVSRLTAYGSADSEK